MHGGAPGRWRGCAKEALLLVLIETAWRRGLDAINQCLGVREGLLQGAASSHEVARIRPSDPNTALFTLRPPGAINKTIALAALRVFCSRTHGRLGGTLRRSKNGLRPCAHRTEP